MGLAYSLEVKKMKKKELKKRIENLENRVQRLEHTLILKQIKDIPDRLNVTCCEAEKIEDPKERVEYLSTGKKPEPKPAPYEYRRF